MTTAATGGNAVVSYGEGTAVSVTDSTVSTTGDHSGGIHVTGGGELTAWNVDVETQGNSSAAIRSDRGGGTLTVEDGSYVTNGTGSPAIYSTAQIAVTNAVLTANRSEAIVVEGRNSVTLTDCTVSGNMQGTYGPDSGENLHGVMLYQSMSGDAQEGQSLFRMTGGELITLSGDLFYVTNTDCAIELSGVALTLADGCLLRVEGNTGERGWGTPGENGGRCTLNAIAQALSGTIRVDETSSLDMTLSDGATFEGTVNPEGQGGEVNVTLAPGLPLDPHRRCVRNQLYRRSFLRGNQRLHPVYGAGEARRRRIVFFFMGNPSSRSDACGGGFFECGGDPIGWSWRCS